MPSDSGGLGDRSSGRRLHPGSEERTHRHPGVEPTGTVEFWHFFTDREATAIDDVVNDFEAKHPKINVTRQGRPGRRQDDPGHRRRQRPGRRRCPTPPTSSASSAPPAPGSTSTPYIAARQGRPATDTPRVSARTPSTGASGARCRSWPTRTASTTTRRCFAEAGIAGAAEDAGRADRRWPRS